jgi:hypothetical protein
VVLAGDARLLQLRLQQAEAKATTALNNYHRVREERNDLLALKAQLEEQLATLQQQLDWSNGHRYDLQDAVEHAVGGSAADSPSRAPAGPSKRSYTEADLAKAVADNAKHAKQLASVAAKPQIFDGTSSGGRSNVRDWLMSIGMYFKLMSDIIPESQRVNTAATYLKGEALRFWHFRLGMLTPEEQNDMRVFETALTERFDSANDPVTARYKLDKLRQGRTAMRQHVQRFDTLCSYIPDMQDAEKIHRFLTSVRAECTSTLSSDPSTGARWAQYADLRRYALNHFAHERVLPPDAAGAMDATCGTLRDVAAVVKAAAGGRKRTHSDLMDTDSPADSRGGRGGTPRGQQQNKSGCTNANSFRDKRKQWVRRTEAIKDYCKQKGLCGICYEPGHIATTCDKSKMKPGNPPGFRG